ncbi:zinc finger protein 184-like [Anopheles nili]|uniref:zinc finger protein 184-like n=1 Tax=Anopheles nili TaxID=185578 RepID=UPI00237B3D13|nr:zinc finger protein 184-like [Anopheles nili]
MKDAVFTDLGTRFYSVCRFCVSDSDCLPLFLPDGSFNEELQKAFEIIAAKVDESDGLPNNICRNCLQIIENFVDFESNCCDSYEILEQFMRNSSSVENLEISEEVVKQISNDEIDIEILKEDISASDYIDDCDEELVAFDEQQKSEEIKKHMETSFLGDNSDIDQNLPEEIDSENDVAIAVRRTSKSNTKQSDNDEDYKNEVTDDEKDDGKQSSNYKMDELNMNAANATVLDYFYRNNRKIPIVQCIFCNRTYRGRNTLRKHLKIHFQIKDYTCDQCPQSFSDRSSLRSHQQRHSTIKPFLCGQCPRSYYSEVQLKQHLTMKHGKRKYVCPICYKRFPSQAILDDHALVHKPERPFVCYICGNSFKRNRNLDRHLRGHEKDKISKAEETINSTQTNISCQFCASEFDIPSKLLDHLIQSHSEAYQTIRMGVHHCPHCHTQFDDLSDCLHHQNKHYLIMLDTGKTVSYECGECGKHIKYKSLAEKHFQSHQSERSFTCSVENCSKRYKFKVHLTRHFREIHEKCNE